ncbi:hypothetical protein SeMB42_g02631 [Synchytrium endobioticum]|uniref:Mediator of RNA polymerase II transcription subunit 12 n=1 Tax=Synchytrium endobioticum TaxID=286115 RepID=A0A507DEV7_9FUNG|nr:hypothetical protein SeMB42_g02631 [Synchytrium endobioticum]
MLKRKPFSIQPPDKVLSRSNDLGYAGIYPQRELQDEDELSESNVRQGFVDRPHPILQDERLSAFELYYQDSNHTNLLNGLSGFISEVLKNQRGIGTIPDVSRYKLPDRVVVSDIKQWMTKLANENESLQELAKGVPQGVKGEQLVSLLIQHQVPVARATWLVRFVGASEIRLRRQAKPSEDSNYEEWTVAIVSQLRRLYDFINQPIIKQPKAIAESRRWNSSEERKRFLNRWKYMLSLIKYQYAEGLIDQRTFLRWVLDTFMRANFDQTFFMLQLANFQDTQAVASSKGNELVRQQHLQLSHLLQYMLVIAPDLGVAPKSWTQYKELILAVLDMSPQLIHMSRMRELLATTRLQLRERNEFLIHGGRTVSKSSQDPIEFLDNISLHTNLDELYAKWLYANDEETQLESLFQWAITPYRMGHHRPYIVGAILSRYAKDERLGERRDVQRPLQVFLDSFSSDSIQERQQLSELYGEMIRRDLFSLDTYIQRLISRGDLEGPAIHNRFAHIKDLPIYNASVNQINHRRVSLFGVSCHDDEEKAYLTVCETIISRFPDICGRPDLLPVARDIEQEYSLSRLDPNFVKRLEALPKYLRVRIAQWLANHVFGYLVTDKPIGVDNFKATLNPGNSKLSSRQLAVIVGMLESMKEHRIILKLCLWMLNKTIHRTIFPYIVDTFRRHQRIFHAMEELQSIFLAIFAKHLELRKSQKHDRCFVLTYLEIAGHVDELPLASGGRDAPTAFDDIRNLKDDQLTVAAATSNLTWSYQTNRDAVKSVFIYVFDNLRRIIQISKSIHNVRRTMEINVEVLRFLNDRCQFLDDLIIEYLNENVLSFLTSNNPTSRFECELLTNHSDFKSSSMLLFLSLLTIARVVSAQRLLHEFVDIVLKRATDDGLNYLLIPLYINTIRLSQIILAVADTSDIAPGLFLTTQDLQSIYTIRECDLMSDETLHCAPLRTFLILSKLAATISLTEDGSANLVASCIAEVRTPIIQDATSWLKRICVENPTWAYQVMVAVSADVGGVTIRLGTDASVLHFANCALFHSVVSDSTTESEITSTIQLSVEYCRVSFQKILRKMSDWTFDRLWIELQFMFDRIVAFGVSAGTSTLIYFDTFVSVLFERLLEPEIHTRFLSKLVKGLRGNVLSRLLHHISWSLEGELELPPTCRAERLNGGIINDWCKALRGDVKNMKIFTDFAILCIQTAANTRMNGEDNRYSSELTVMAGSLCSQLDWFQTKLPVFDLMELAALSFQEASRVWQQCSYSLAMALDNLRQGRVVLEKNAESQSYIGDLRAMMYLRLRLLLPLVPVVLDSPQECQLLPLVQTLVSLLTARITHGTDTEVKLFDLVLDLVSWISDDVAKDLKNQLLNTLRELQPQLCIPDAYVERVQRILPFQIQNPYVKRLVATTYTSSNSPHRHQQRSASPSLPSSSTIGSLAPSHQGQLASAVPVSQTPHFKPWEWAETVQDPEVAATAVIHPEVLNDGPISLSLFGALRIASEELVYNRMFNDGWQAGDLCSVRSILDGTKNGLDTDIMAEWMHVDDVGKLIDGSSYNTRSGSNKKREEVGDAALPISKRVKS